MNNYFNNAQVNWNTWTPQDIIFKSNNIVKQLMPQENVLSYKSKSDRDVQMCKLTNGKAYHNNYSNATYYSRDNYRAVHVWLKDVKSEYPTANIDFIDYTNRTDSVGNAKACINVLIYIQSFHQPWEWKRDQNGNYIKVNNANPSPLQEGYRICYGGQGDSNPLSHSEFQEVLDITESVRRFLFEMLIPYRNGELLVA